MARIVASMVKIGTRIVRIVNRVVLKVIIILKLVMRMVSMASLGWSL